MSFVYTSARKARHNTPKSRVMQKIDRNPHWRGHLPLAFILEWHRFLSTLKDKRPFLKNESL